MYVSVFSKIVFELFSLKVFREWKEEKLHYFLITILHIHLFPNVQVVFLPPNTTSVLQPTGQGVIRSLKVHYRGRVVRQLCRALDKTKTLPKISILQAMKILVSSWEAVSAQTIVNCFRKAGIIPEAQNAAITDADDRFSSLKESLRQLHDIDPDMVPEGVTPENLIDFYNEVIATAPMITDDDILRRVTTNQQGQSGE